MTRSVKGIARHMRAEDRQARQAAAKARDPKKIADSFQNFAAALGMGAENLMSGSTYGFNPVTRIRTLLEWIHRGSWLGGIAIDLVADDMTRAGVDIKGEIEPDEIQAIEQDAVHLGLWNAINDTIKWSRLYGGSLGILLVDGQKLSTPFRVETVGKDQFRGVMAVDRWMVEPSMQDLVQDMGPHFGLPKFYRVTQDAPGLYGQQIHYTRCLRLEGIRLPYWQRLMENLWGISVLERLYDRMVAFDSATTGAAQLAFKAYLRTVKIKGLRNLIASGGKMYEGLLKQIQFMRMTQSNEGLTILDGEDEFEGHQNAAFSGLDLVIQQLAQQLSGALQIPITRLFGQSPGGLNATGESDERTYYDGIKQQQNRHLLAPMTMIYRCVAQSLGFVWPAGTSLEFRSLWQLTETDRITAAKELTETILSAQSTGLVSDRVALQELKQGSDVTGVWSNITSKDIAAASDVPTPPLPPMPGEPGAGGGGEGGTADAAAVLTKLSKKEAHYVDKATGKDRCELCARFNAPDSCMVVDGEINPAGWCEFFRVKG